MGRRASCGALEHAWVIVDHGDAHVGHGMSARGYARSKVWCAMRSAVGLEYAVETEGAVPRNTEHLVVHRVKTAGKPPIEAWHATHVASRLAIPQTRAIDFDRAMELAELYADCVMRAGRTLADDSIVHLDVAERWVNFVKPMLARMTAAEREILTMSGWRPTNVIGEQQSLAVV